MPSDAIIVGAGGAGLAAARLFSRAGRSAILVEARSRLGGRMFTREQPGVAAPIELGAEFIHGQPRITADLLRDAGTKRVDVDGNGWERRGGALRGGADRFEVARRLLGRAGAVKDDISVEDFLTRVAREPELQEEARWFRLLVAGFDAADPHRAGLKAIVEEWSGPTLAGTQGRPLGGYGPLVNTLARSLDPQHVTVRLQSVVEEIGWKPGAVTVSGNANGAAFRLEARCAIVTIPVSMFARIRFVPDLDERKRKALGAIAMGPVVKVVLCFHNNWWESLGAEYRDGGFFSDSEAEFPTVWTQLPQRVPILTAWAGGPYAARLAGLGEDELVRRAQAAVCAIFRPPHAPDLVTAFVHDWDSDPFACGAYSYVLVGGAGARTELGLPLGDVLYFAGEATSNDEPGTVSGALNSGERAAQLALQSL